MDWPATLAIGAFALAAAAFCGWRGALPPDLTRGPRLIPWRPLMLLFATAAFLMIVRAGSLLHGG